MIIIVGLGNPGQKFENTRHNVGFMALDLFQKKNNFPDFELNKKANSLISKQNNVLLMKPQTFMNESGKAVAGISKKFFLKIKTFVIVHDDIDLPLGKIKIVKERGSAGHKGVESVMNAVDKKGLTRFRIGIGSQEKSKANDVVLENFSNDEQPALKESLQKTMLALETFLKDGLEKTMNQFNK